ncbi:MAG TPA: 1-acyl-sn-glycerol-3-phosphate acyltransferase [Bacteroidales bacterium]|nr:1-acyl-sn-glycerol-3-phosphate acyltransferase [Bacteroidales bacterium]
MDFAANKLIDVEKVIASKNPRLLKILPKFVINYLKKILHQEEINKVLYEYKDTHGLYFVRNILKNFNAKINVSGLENIPSEGACIVAANHPLGGLDGMALMHVVGTIRKDIIFPVNDLLLNLPNLKELFIPINKHGSNVENINILEEAFLSDKIILYFPAGLCSRKIKGKIYDLEWKKTFITKAKQYKRDIIPTYIDGQNSNFFYKLANLRKTLGIKANIEMLYLVDEMYKQYNKEINITFGKKIPFFTFTKDKKDIYWAAYVKNIVYSLSKVEKEFKPIEI